METTNITLETDNESLWKVGFTAVAAKQREKLPKVIAAKLLMLAAEMREEGPVQPEWHHYGKLAGKRDTHHCHLNKGKPRYVAVWEVIDRTVRIITIRYAGTHEKVNYDK
jgi:plasmid maintenance system killer protein